VDDPTESTADRISRLYVAYSRDALRLATALTGDTTLAADIVQTAFVRLLSRYRDIRGPELFYGYLRKTIVNLVRDSARRSAVEQRALRRFRRSAAADARNPINPSALVDSDAHFLSLINGLTQKQRTILVLRYFEDLSEAETASIMGVSTSSVKANTHRAMVTLRRMQEKGLT